MVILSIRTDKPEAEIGVYQDGNQLSYETWQAHRQLAETLHLKIRSVLNESKLRLQDINGIIVFQGPGSFTGLRIGIAVANALAASLSVPIIGGTGEHWTESALERLQNNEDRRMVVPEYGSLPNITAPRK